MLTKKTAALFSIITVVSFCGFWVENIWLGITHGYMDNRNMTFPFLLGYGLAIGAIFLMFGTPQRLRFFAVNIDTGNKYVNTLIYFLFVCVCVFFGECLLGNLTEAVCGIVWWDYTQIPLHFTKYTSIPTTLGFGLLITVFMGFLFVPMYKKFLSIDSRVFRITVFALMALMVADFIRSGIKMYQNHYLLYNWKFDFSAIIEHRYREFFIIES